MDLKKNKVGSPKYRSGIKTEAFLPFAFLNLSIKHSIVLVKYPAASLS